MYVQGFEARRTRMANSRNTRKKGSLPVSSDALPGITLSTNNGAEATVLPKESADATDWAEPAPKKSVEEIIFDEYGLDKEVSNMPRLLFAILCELVRRRMRQ